MNRVLLSLVLVACSSAPVQVVDPNAPKYTTDVKPILDACARSSSIRKQYVALVEETIARLSRATERSQKKKAVRADLSGEGMGLMLVCLVIGVQTLMDLEVPIDPAKNASSILKLLQP